MEIRKRKRKRSEQAGGEHNRMNDNKRNTNNENNSNHIKTENQYKHKNMTHVGNTGDNNKIHTHTGEHTPLRSTRRQTQEED